MAVTKDVADYRRQRNSNKPPVVGDLHYDPIEAAYHVYDGHNWHLLPGLEHDDAAARNLLNEIRNRRDLTDVFLEALYPDLKKLRLDYDELRDRYRLFEVLKSDTERKQT